MRGCSIGIRRLNQSQLQGGQPRLSEQFLEILGDQNSDVVSVQQVENLLLVDVEVDYSVRISVNANASQVWFQRGFHRWLLLNFDVIRAALEKVTVIVSSIRESELHCYHIIQFIRFGLAIIEEVNGEIAFDPVLDEIEHNNSDAVGSVDVYFGYVIAIVFVFVSSN